jgi:biopolymer transport protein ExbD
MARKQRIRRKHPAVELNITAFMNLMVVLVPFLLMTAVFTQITILDLNLPPAGSQGKDKEKRPPLEFRVTIRSDELVLSDSRGGLIKRIGKTQNGHNFVLLKETLKTIKARFPDKTNLTILSEAKTPYNDMIRVMDSARSYAALVDGEQVFAELFPDISIGDAAERKASK